MDHGALDHALEPGGGLGILVALGHQVVELGLDVGDEAALELLEVDIAGAHHGGRVLILDQRQQEMFQRGVFVVALVRERERAVQGLLEAAGKSWHYALIVLVLPISSGVGRRPAPRRPLPHIVTSSPSRTAEDADVCGQSPSPA